MRSLLAFFFALIAVFSFANVCEGAPSSDDVQEESGEISVSTADEDQEIEKIAEEIENELEDAIAEMFVENEENTVVEASKLNPALKFPSLKKAGKANRKLNEDMAIKVASIVEQAMLLVANDILQTTVLLQTDPEDFLQEANTTSTSE